MSRLESGAGRVRGRWILLAVFVLLAVVMVGLKSLWLALALLFVEVSLLLYAGYRTDYELMHPQRVDSEWVDRLARLRERMHIRRLTP